MLKAQRPGSACASPCPRQLPAADQYVMIADRG